ncbi:MAG: HyaD/HybD family hydrogenase maturation endopeptidase [Aeromicrobium sp.]
MTSIGPTVLGIGNPLMGDDGIGIELLEQLMSRQPLTDVEYVDGGTIGLSLLPIVLDARSLLVLDAVTGGSPGTVVHLTGDQLPRLLQTKLSPHQVGLLDVLASARLLGSEPTRLAVVGITPGFVDMRLGLSPEVEAAIPLALTLARRILRDWRETEIDACAAGEYRPREGGHSCSETSIST